MLIICFDYEKVAFYLIYEGKEHYMANMIEKYYMEDGQPKVVMNQNTAREVRSRIKGFRAGIEMAGFSEANQLLFTGQHVADEFLVDTVSWSVIQEYVETDDGIVPGPTMFLKTVEDKIGELLG